jgi:hypothetical protein
MVHDFKKADLEVSQHDSQDISGPVQNQGLPPVKDNESKREETDRDSIHTALSSDTIEPVEVVEEDQLPQRSKSRSSSVRSRPLIIVARSKRRGLLGRLTIIPEVENTYAYTNKTKWVITLIVAMAAAAAPLGSAIFYRKY